MNPQVAFATKNGAKNTVPSFIHANGPVREARFVKNAGRHGRRRRARALHGRRTRRRESRRASSPRRTSPPRLNANNVIFRIPTPVFGAGLIESIPDATIVANASANLGSKQPLGIAGRANFQVSGAP